MEAPRVLRLLSCLDTVIVKVEVLSSLQRKAPPSLKTCSFHWDLTHRDLFARVSWLSMPEILSWAFQPDPSAFRADSEARVQNLTIFLKFFLAGGLGELSSL